MFKSKFPERLVKEFPFITKIKNWRKEQRYRIRLVFREDRRDGIHKTILDIRKYIIMETHSYLTEDGIYLTRDEFEKFYAILTEIKNNPYLWKGLDNGGQQGNRTTNPIGNQTQS